MQETKLKALRDYISENKLKNTYYGVRHGESIANVEKLIVSSFETQKGYGLTTKGKEQAKSTKESYSFLNSDFVILSSDFERALETATIIGECIGVSPTKTPLLRDRFFGSLDNSPASNYDKVWEHDPSDMNYKGYKNESVQEVLDRLTKLILELEEKYTDKNILLVSHGDPLGILETQFKGVPAGEFRTIEKIPNAGVRRFSRQK